MQKIWLVLVGILIAVSSAEAAPPSEVIIPKVALVDYLAAPANPVNLTVAPGFMAASMPINAKSGGRVSLTSLRGDTFELTIPPGALVVDTKVTLIEISEMSHPSLPESLGGTGVSILPEGTELLKPATLVIKSAVPLNPSQITPFSTDDLGRNARIAMVKTFKPTGEVELNLLHFSNYVVWDGPSVDEIIEAGLADNERIRIEGWFNNEILQSKRRGNEAPLEAWNKMIDDMFDKVVKPAVERATTCGATFYAFDVYADWSHKIQILGGQAENFAPKNFKENLLTLIKKSADVCLKEAIKACYEDHRPIEATIYAYNFIRNDQIMNGDGNGGLAGRFYELVEKCGHFRLEFDSEIWVGENRQNSYGNTAKAAFDFQLDLFTDEVMNGMLDVEEVYLNSEGMICERDSLHTKPSQIFVSNFLKGGIRGDKNFMLTIGNLLPYSMAKFTCRDIVNPNHKETITVPPAEEGTFWGGMWMALHGPGGTNEMIPSQAMFALRDWTVRNDTRYAERHYAQVLNSFNENTNIVIFHKPIPMPPERQIAPVTP